MGIEDIRDALVVRERSVFLLTDTQGNATRGNSQGYGLYHADTRHLSAYALTLNGAEPVILLSTAELGFAMEQVMTNRTMVAPDGRRIARGSIELRRQRTVADVLEERLRITNFNPFPVTLALRWEFEADFADIFDVRGYQRARHGTPFPPELGDRSIHYHYTGIDGRDRDTTITADTTPLALDAGSMLFRVTLQRRESVTLRLTIAVDGDAHAPPSVGRFDLVAQDYQRWCATATQVLTDNEFFNRVLQRSLSDVRMLCGENEAGDAFLTAGTPWFDALFGRDSCIASMQLAAYRPDLARSTLRLLAKWQGTKVDASRDEEPGKILHELRFDELSRAGELPYGPYYGSIDSTPLFLMLLAEHYAWTGDLRLARELLPAVRAALAWLDGYGAASEGGYLAYEKRSQKGLVNQGWKDSYDGVVHADGSIATPPIALAEAQGYAYAARRRLAPILERLGERELAAACRERSEALRQRFSEDFWIADRKYFAVALDGQGRRVASVTTNPAHGLWSGIIDRPRAADVAARLMQGDIFSGWGLRTLSSGNPRFNPIGYHVGSVWPHDNSIAAMGLKMYGFEDELNELASALFDAATSFSYFRLPELFGGEVRSAHNAPVPYPVACRPQAWAAGSLLLITQAILGLKAEAPERRLRIVNPCLPYWLNSVHVRGLRVGNGRVTLHYRRDATGTHVEVQRATAGIEVVVSDAWPM